MASQPSVHNEERNRLRLRAWEQRNQETSQAKELNPESVPLFGEPYKTNKGDELSSRIQRMLGSYEDVNNPSPFSIDPFAGSTYVNLSKPEQCHPDKSTKPPFHTQVHHMSIQIQNAPCRISSSSQPMGASSAPFSPIRHGHSKDSLNDSQLDLLAHEQEKSEAFSDVRDHGNVPQEMSAQSPDIKPLSCLHSSNHSNTDTDNKVIFDRHQLQGSPEPLSASASTMDVSTLNIKQSPKDASLPQANRTNTLPSQTFPLPLSSKQPSVVTTQKPTAYVRPMDGQDQVVSESPELKPSPEPYAPLTELINKSEQGKLKILPQFLEARTNEGQCVEDILREMTHSWPPLLTALHTPSTDDPPKSPVSAKEAESAPSCPVQKSYDSSTDPSQLNPQNSSSLFKAFEAAHSSGVESASSSDSESSSRSESDSESATEEPPQPSLDSSIKTEPDTPAVSHGDWQLVNWIRSNHQNSSNESQGGALVSKSPAHKRLQPTQSSRQSTVDVVDPTRESKGSSHQIELSNNIAKPQQSSKVPQDNGLQQSSQQSPLKLQCNTRSSKPAKAGRPDHTEAARKVKCEEATSTRENDPCFADKPKVKTKTRHSKKSKDTNDSKRETKRTAKQMSLDKRKAGSDPEPEATPFLYSHCPSCGARHPKPCSCLPQNPAQPDQLSPTPPVKVSCSKFKAENTCQKVTKMPRKTTHKGLEKTELSSKGSRDLSRPPTCLLVTIDLNLLSRVPQASSSHQESPSSAMTSASFFEQDGRGTDATAIHKIRKKSIPHNAEVDKKSHPRKKQKLENKNTSSALASVNLEYSSNPAESQEQKKAKKTHVQLHPSLTTKDSKLHKRNPEETQESIKESVKRKDSCKHKRRRVKQTVQPQPEKKPSKSSLAVPSSSQSNRETLSSRPLLRFEDRQYPVKHYIKEAKRLKHKADAESDKLSKAFNYLDAAMYFVESGIAMEKDPQISTSSYTMFSETVELLKFVLKLKNTVDLSAPSSEMDFLALCLKCQSLLQMAMFRHKQKTALDYSKTLADHFSTSAQAPHDPSVLTAKVTDTPATTPSMMSPTKMSTSSTFNHSLVAGSRLGAVGSTVALTQDIEQVAFSYVNITTLFLRAHDNWEQAEELAHKGSGMLTELDTFMGPLSLTSSMGSMVRYTRQGVHWLRLDSKKLK
ncbi:hypothetical protein Q5P01_024845 [Channa striata]|uniref:AF4/FMR2 C-terminal homology domain-containing protein n=1 Tax=Channa striata TaxID=64152 RepID=A0AA88J0H2_CHASR|nr:hypothetical protein Q5P01_024845 [Channa striata]